MLKLLFILFTFPIIGIAQTKVIISWTSGNVGTKALPTCSSNQPKGCVYGFTLNMDGKQIAGPSKLGVSAKTFIQTPLPKAGNHLYSLVMNGYDAVGNSSVSKAATITVKVPVPVTIPAPKNLATKVPVPL